MGPADRGCGVVGLSMGRHRNCCPDIGDAGYGTRFFKRPGAETAVIADAGVIADVGHASCDIKLSIWSGCALGGYADWGCIMLPKGIEVSSCGLLRGGVPSAGSASSSPSSALRLPRFGRSRESRARSAMSSSSGTPSRPCSE